MAEGYLSKSGADVTWDSQVTLGQPFTVRVPVWAWGTGRNLIYGDGTPIAMIIVGAVLRGDGGIAGVCPPGGPRARAVAAAVGMIVPASAAPHGSRPPHHPDLP